MKSPLPKVLHLLKNQPLIGHVINNLKNAGISSVITVVGYNGQEVIDALGNVSEYVWQHEQLGTGHAVMQAEKIMMEFKGKVIVACGDVPLISNKTFQSLIDASLDESVEAVVLTMELDNPHGYGRIVKDDEGFFRKIVEEKDASENIKDIKEVNTGTYIFDKEYLFEGLKRVDTNNAQGEYYLPDALNYILDSGKKVNIVKLDDPIEGSGINTKEDLQVLENLLKNI
jgi:bifunctional UDP-N-acetylglucosamine pyrophosphorylase/glucosamine-1-phosphate N-acetyltransferase